MTIRIRAPLPVLLATALMALPTPAHADLQLCNRMSYVVEAAIGIEDKGAAATRGWFRIDPGACRTVMQGEVQAETLYVHARALAVYGASPLPHGGHADLCVANENFILAAARSCSGRAGQKLARFTAVKPCAAHFCASRPASTGVSGIRVDAYARTRSRYAPPRSRHTG